MKSARERFEDGTVIFREGDPGPLAYVIVSGTVTLVKNSPSGPVHLAKLGKGDLLGEMALVDGGTRSASALAAGEVILQPLLRDDLMDRFQRDPEMAFKILGKLTKRLRITDDRLVAVMDRLVTLSASMDHGVGGGGTAPMASGVADAEGFDAGRGGFLDRLLQAFRFRSAGQSVAGRGPGGGYVSGGGGGADGQGIRPLTVVVAAIDGDQDADVRKAIAALLEEPMELSIRTSHRVVGDPNRDPPQTPAQSFLDGCRLAQKEDADLLIWGVIDAQAGLLYLRFATPYASEDDRLGAPGSLTFLTLPILVDEGWAPILRAVVMAALEPRAEAHVHAIAAHLPGLVEAAQAIGTAPPGDFTPLEQAGLLACFANAAATLALYAREADWYGLAVDCYGAAIGLLPQEADGEWAAFHRSVGLVLQALGERTDDLEALGQAADAYAAALEAMMPRETPREWAALKNRLGMVRFKLDLASGNLDGLKEAVADLQSALQVYTRQDYPARWAEVMNNMAQVLQVYGDHLRSTEVLQRAVDCCEQALEVRSFNDHPMLWAGTENNLGSALFLLAKHTQNQEYLERASTSFQAALGTYKLHNAKRLAAVALKNLGRVEELLKSQGTRQVVDPVWANAPQTVGSGEQDWLDDTGLTDPVPQTARSGAGGKQTRTKRAGNRRAS